MRLSPVIASLLTAALCVLWLADIGSAQPPRGSRTRESGQTSKLTPGIAWYGVLADGLAEAKETGKPILLVSAAPQCTGVPGMW